MAAPSRTPRRPERAPARAVPSRRGTSEAFAGRGTSEAFAGRGTSEAFAGRGTSEAFAGRGTGPTVASDRAPQIVARSSRETAAPWRSCVGCGRHDEAEALVRVVFDEVSKGVVVDAKGGAFGRGAHVHADRRCLEAACKKGLARAFREEVKTDLATLSTGIAEAFTRRIVGLLFGGLRGGEVVFGTDVVTGVCRDNRASLVVIAADAASASKRSEIARATAEGRSLVFGDKRSLAAALGRKDDPARDGVAVVAVTSSALAKAIRTAWLRIAGAQASGGVADPNADRAGVDPMADCGVVDVQSYVAVSEARTVEAGPSTPAESTAIEANDGAVSEDG
ncbi:MAG: DUF448 domain-containing protein [Polyangiales bacterium]